MCILLCSCRQTKPADGPVSFSPETYIDSAGTAEEQEDEYIQLTYENDFPGKTAFSSEMERMGLYVTDVNFDGHMDVIIKETHYYATHSRTQYNGWLWDAKSKQFVFSESLTKINNPVIDSERECIYSSGHIGFDNDYYRIYRYIDGKFVETNSLWYTYNLYDYNLETITEWAFVDGELVIIREETISDGDDLIEMGFTHDGFWDLGHWRWYISD